MSFLTPLYALGALAVAAPVLFHLIRRTPRGEVPFSSLMFLSPSPPRLTRRSRLEHVALLLLRAAALCLLAAAFARPFLRQAASAGAEGDEPRRVALLIDTSASLRRDGLWTKARALADQAIAACRPADQLAVFAFDVATRPVLGFDESRALGPSRRQAVATARLGRLSPSWGATDLGQALIDAASALQDAGDAKDKTGRMPRRVVLVSDLQQGSRLDALQAFEWPSDVELELKVVPDDRSNAGLQRLADAQEAEASANPSRPIPEPAVRVRVANDPGSRRESFALTWVDEKGAATGKPVAVYVPPGESRVARVPWPDPSRQARGSLRLRLEGDEHPFDNTLFVAAEPKDEATVLYLGRDAPDDPAGLLYYLERAAPESPRRVVRVVRASPSSALAKVPDRATAMAVVASETSPENAAKLREYARGGGTVLYVATAPGPATTLAAIAGAAPFEIQDAAGAGARDMLLGEIAFDHPLFAPLAGPQFNDFTKVRFWKHRRVDPAALGGSRVLARFDNGDAALIEKPVGKGRLVVLASGWNPADSQLARSSKFVPMISGLLQGREPWRADAPDLHVFDRVPLPEAKARVVRKPDGTTVRPAAGAASFDGTDVPGVYTLEVEGDGPRPFAVNLDPAESKTAPLRADTLEQLGCKLEAGPARKAAERERLRQLQSAELEDRQKLWRPLVVAAVVVLTLETWLAGRLGRPRPAADRVEATAA